MEPPFIIVDASSYTGANPDWRIVAEMPHTVGIVIKATQGVSYSPAWFQTHWQQVKAVGGSRYGSTWFRGAYHFLSFDVDGAAQADYYLDAIERAGGWGDGDIWPIVDVERGQPTSSNYDDGAAKVIAVTTAFARRIKQRTGKKVILYGRGAMRDLGIFDRMGCDYVWNPSWTAEMAMNGLAPPWAIRDVVLWQYAGDGSGASAHGMPLLVPGFSSNVDMSMFVDDGNYRTPSISTLKWKLTGRLGFGAGILTLGFGIMLAFALWYGARRYGSRFGLVSGD